MAIFTFVLGLLLVVAGAGGLVGSYDLLPTEIGLLYALCGTLALSAGVVTLAIGALIRRFDVFAAAMRSSQNGDSRQSAPAAAPSLLDREPRPSPSAAREPAFADAPAAREPAFADAPAAREPAFADAPAAREPAFADAPAAREPAFADAPAAIEVEPNAPAADEPVNENRSGHLPTIAAIEHALGEPEPAPTLVGRYSAGGANYMIFSDGSIEAETKNGAYKFASMSDFKAYLAGARG
jgi:hypothetical protein